MADSSGHGRALTHAVSLCRQADPACGVQLQGSVARGNFRPDSDVDLTVVLSREAPLEYNELITRSNHPGMIRVRLSEFGVDVDVNWLSTGELLGIVESRGALDWWMFLRGVPLHDPSGSARKCRLAISNWFDAHPDMAEAWRRQQEAVERHKLDPAYRLRFARQPEFVAHLSRIADLKKRMPAHSVPMAMELELEELEEELETLGELG